MIDMTGEDLLVPLCENGIGHSDTFPKIINSLACTLGENIFAWGPKKSPYFGKTTHRLYIWSPGACRRAIPTYKGKLGGRAQPKNNRQQQQPTTTN